MRNCVTGCAPTYLRECSVLISSAPSYCPLRSTGPGDLVLQLQNTRTANAQRWNLAVVVTAKEDGPLLVSDESLSLSLPFTISKLILGHRTVIASDKFVFRWRFIGSSTPSYTNLRLYKVRDSITIATDVNLSKCWWHGFGIISYYRFHYVRFRCDVLLMDWVHITSSHLNWFHIWVLKQITEPKNPNLCFHYEISYSILGICLCFWKIV